MSYQRRPRPSNPSSTANIILYILSLILPPLPVFIKTGCSANFIINLVLTFLAWFPGIVHAIWVVWRYEARYKLTGNDEYARRAGYWGGETGDGGRERDEVTGAYLERGTAGNMEGYYGPPPRPMSFQAPQAPKTVQIPVYDGHDQRHEQEKMGKEMNEKHEYRFV